jgi:hypothetical protein
VINVDGKCNVVHSSGKKLGGLQKVLELEARKEWNSMRAKDGHFPITKAK